MTNRISNLPDAPLASDNQTIFNNKAFPFVAALQPFADEVNAVVGEMNSLHDSTVSASQNATAKSAKAESSATFAETKALEAEVYAELLKSYTVGSSQVRVGSIVGSMRNGRANVSTSSGTTMTFNADELVVCSALGGLSYKISSVSATIDISLSSIGGIDVGPNIIDVGPNISNGFAAIYAIYNPTTGAVMLVGIDCTSSVPPEIYQRAMPAGYSASALVSIVRISGGKLTAFRQRDRTINYSTNVAGYTLIIDKDSSLIPPSVTLTLDVPYGAKEVTCSSRLSISSTNVTASFARFLVGILSHSLLTLDVAIPQSSVAVLSSDSAMLSVTPVTGREISFSTSMIGSLTGDALVNFFINVAGYKF